MRDCLFLSLSLSLFLLEQVNTADLRTEHRPMRMVISGFRRGMKQIWAVLELYSAKNIVSYRRFGTTCPSHTKGQAWTLNMGPIWPLKMGWKGCLETSVMTYHFALLRKIPKRAQTSNEARAHDAVSGTLESRLQPRQSEYNRQTVTDSGTGANVASAASVASISSRTQLRYGYHLWQTQISLKLQNARGTGDMRVYIVTDLKMTHYLAEACSLNVLHVQRNTALSLTELSFLIQVIRTTGLVHG